MLFYRNILCVLGIGLGQIVYGGGAPQTSVSQNSKYPQFCYLAAQDDKVFQTFRSQQTYREIVETVNSMLGSLFVDEIKERYPYLLPYFEKICLEDKIGGPLSYLYPGIGLISPTVLRYVKVLGDLQKEFGDLSKFHIIEIGGGFGGQCKIVHDIGGFSKYDIIDIPEVVPLIKKYVSCFPIANVTALGYNMLQKFAKCDLVISNYAFSEINRAGQLWYMEMIINQAPRGYIIYNHFPGINPLSLNEFVGLLQKSNKTVKIIHEDPRRTGDIIVWGSRDDIGNI